jgi:hypothetical protein
MVVSEFDELTDEEKVEALRRLCTAAFAISANSFAVLAKRGLLHPEEVDVVLSTLAELLDKLPVKLRAAFPERLTEKLTDIRRVAAANWKDV